LSISITPKLYRFSLREKELRVQPDSIVFREAKKDKKLATSNSSFGLINRPQKQHKKVFAYTTFELWLAVSPKVTLRALFLLTLPLPRGQQ